MLRTRLLNFCPPLPEHIRAFLPHLLVTCIKAGITTLSASRASMLHDRPGSRAFTIAPGPCRAVFVSEQQSRIRGSTRPYCPCQGHRGSQRVSEDIRGYQRISDGQSAAICCDVHWILVTSLRYSIKEACIMMRCSLHDCVPEALSILILIIPGLSF